MHLSWTHRPRALVMDPPSTCTCHGPTVHVHLSWTHCPRALVMDPLSTCTCHGSTVHVHLSWIHCPRALVMDPLSTCTCHGPAVHVHRPSLSTTATRNIPLHHQVYVDNLGYTRLCNIAIKFTLHLQEQYDCAHQIQLCTCSWWNKMANVSML